MSDFLKNIVKKSGNIYASVAEDGIQSADVKGWIDTGSYTLNALLSGSIFGGMPSNKRICLAGESTTGKTFFLLGIIKFFLESDPTAQVVLFESESAISRDIMENRGIDVKRIAVMPVATIEEFRTQAVNVLDEYLDIPEDKRPPMLIGLDSLGMLSTNKEVNDTADGKETRDMTRPGLIRGAFRVLTLKTGKANVPMLMTNHTYSSIGMFPTKELSGGGGAKYAADSIIFLSKKKKKDGSKVVGNLIGCTNHKSRLTIENERVDVQLTYKGGLDRYYGLVDLAVEGNVFKKVGNKIRTPASEKPQYEKVIYSNPEKYFTQDVLEKIDEYTKSRFLYGNQDINEIEKELDEELNVSQTPQEESTP